MEVIVKLEGILKQYALSKGKKTFVVQEQPTMLLKTEIRNGKILLSVSDKDVADFIRQKVGGKIKKCSWDGYSYPFQVWVAAQNVQTVKTKTQYLTPVQMGAKFQFVMQKLAKI